MTVGGLASPGHHPRQTLSTGRERRCPAEGQTCPTPRRYWVLSVDPAKVAET